MKKNKFIEKLMKFCDITEIICAIAYLSIVGGILIAGIIKLATGG